MHNKDFTAVAREMMRGVVQIHVEGVLENDSLTTLNPDFVVPANWGGSGFFIETRAGDGYILTNAHVVRNACKIEVTSMLTSEEPFRAEIVGMVKGLEPDIAIIRLMDGELERYRKLSGEGPYCLPLAKEVEIERGFSVKAIGYPLGMVEPNITGGEVTNFISSFGLATEKYVTDAAINPGNSGGPAIDIEGRVIGINTSIVQGAENVGFITPISFANIIIENLLNHNEPKLADLGGSLQKNSQSLANYFSMNEPQGVVVVAIEQGGTLESLGIKQGDVILTINGVEFDRHGIAKDKQSMRHKNLFDLVKHIPVGDDIKITYRRDAKNHTVIGKAKIAPSWGVDSEPIIPERRHVSCLGMVIQQLSYEIINALENIDHRLQIEFVKRLHSAKPSLVVTLLAQDGQANMMDWVVGDLITHVEGEVVHTLEDFVGILTNLQPKKSHAFIQCASGRIGHFSLKDQSFEIHFHRTL